MTGYVEPSLKEAKPGERFQFQRIGYFNVDKDSTSDHLVFNKTVGLRDSWEKQKPQEKEPQPKHQNNDPQRKAIDIIQQLGKKYTNLPEEKQLRTKAEIQELAKNLSYEELEPWFNTAAKKIGTRIATTIALGVLLEQGLERNEDIRIFIQNGIDDNDALLQKEAISI